MNRDYQKKNQELGKEKKSVSVLDEPKPYLAYFWRGEELCFIGQNSSIGSEKYVKERIAQHGFSHYYIEELGVMTVDDIVNYHAEMILNLLPLNNKSIPKNTKYISSKEAADKYRVNKSEFSELAKKNNAKSIGNTLYLERKVFDEIYHMDPFHEYMPRSKDIIVVMKGDVFKKIEYSLLGGGDQKYFFEKREKNREIGIVETTYPTIQENYKRLLEIQDNSYTVKELIDSDRFIAYSSEGKAIELRAEDKGVLWHKTIPLWIQKRLEKKYHTARDDSVVESEE